MTDDGAEPVSRRPLIAQLWHRHSPRWTLPLVIIVIIAAVAVIDHVDSRRISQVDQQSTSALVAATGGATTVELDQPWSGFNPNTPAGAASSTPTLLSNVLPSAYLVNSKLLPQVNSDLLLSVEVTSTSPLTIQYVINPKAVWSDGVPVSAEDFIYAWQSQDGSGVDVDGQPDQVASTIGYRDIEKVVPSDSGRTVTVTFATPYTDWRDLFDNLLPAHIAAMVGWNHGFDTFNPAIDLSAGPFILHSVTAGQAVLIRNPKWWGTPAVLDRVTVNTTSQPSQWTSALAAGNTVVAQPSSFDLAALDATTSLPNTQSVVKPSLSFLQLEFDTTAPVTLHPANRQAIAHAIDRTALFNQTFGGIDPDLAAADDHLATSAQSEYSQSSASGEYTDPNLLATDRLLKSTGYQKYSLGQYVDAQGKPLTLRLAVELGDPWILTVANALSAQLVAAGFAVVITPVAGTQGLVAAAAANSYDMALVTRVASPYLTATEAWYSDVGGPAGSGGTQDWSKFDDPQVDELFTQAAQDLNPVDGDAIYGQIDDQLWDQMVALPLFEEPGLLANGVQIAGADYNPSEDGVLWNIPLWNTLEPDPAKLKS